MIKNCSNLKEKTMRFLKMFLFTIVLGSILSSGFAATDRLIQTKMPAPSLKDNLFGTPLIQPVIIYLPPSYHTSNNRYPVIYFLPGFTTDVTELIDGTFQGMNIQVAMDSLITMGQIREMIFIVANGRNFLGGSFYVNSPVTGNWEDFIVQDVVGFVDNNYRTFAKSSHRGISGSSMGGFGAINLGMRYPDVFGSVYSLSPGLFDNDGLNNMGIFVPEEKILRYLTKQKEFAAIPETEAREAFKSFISDLYDARSAAQYFWAFSYAYGAALSPNPKKGVPYIDYPYSQSGDRIKVDRGILKNYINGFGGQADKLDAYKANFLKLKGLTIDIGENDHYQWIVQGSRYFSQILEREGIPHQLVQHNGGHEDHLRERIEKHVLPFFSELFK